MSPSHASTSATDRRGDAAASTLPTRVAALVIALVASSVLLGWASGNRLLLEAAPNLTIMNPLTAACLLLMGAAIVLSRSTRSRTKFAKLVLAGAVAVTALAVLLPIMLESRFRLDLFILPKAARLAVKDGMAPNTALCLLVASLACMLTTQRGRAAIVTSQLSALALACLTTLTLIAYVFGATRLFVLDTVDTMAPSTGVCLLALGVGLLWTRPHRAMMGIVTSRQYSGTLERKVLPAVIGVPVMLGVLQVAAIRLHFADEVSGITVFVSATIITCVAVVLLATDGLHEAHRKLAAHSRVLQASEARYRLLAENTTDVIMYLNLDGRIEYISPSIGRLGHDPHVLMGQPGLNLIHPEDRAVSLRRRFEVFGGKQVASTEVRLLRADGAFVWLESVPAPVFDGKVLVGLVTIMRDVTERRAAEAALQEVSAELRRVARASALGVFASSLAHEVNQPLAAAKINSAAGLRWLGQDPMNRDRATKAIERVQRDVGHAADVVKRMRSMVTKEVVATVDFDVNDAIREILVLTERERARSSITLSHIESPCRVHGDRIQFQQVVLNLVTNAIEAMRGVAAKERSLVVSTRTLAGGDVEVAVEDRGPGIEPDKLDLIFEQLFTTKTGGTGLGLPIAKSIVESFGGRLWAESAARRGAIFKMRFPPRTQGDAAPEREAENVMC